MDDTRQLPEHIKLLKQLKERGKALDIRSSIQILQEESITHGLDDMAMSMVVNILRKKCKELGSNNCVLLIKCMIPQSKINSDIAKKLIVWFFKQPVAPTTLNLLVQWLVGCWEYQLVDRNQIYIFYDCFFHTMVNKDKVESLLSQLIYLLTKPEDVTRRQVMRLLNANSKYRKPMKHITALLCLFKSYKPEFVPEKIEALNIQGIWRPLPEVLRMGFEDARDRIIDQNRRSNEFHCNWNVFRAAKGKKSSEAIIPSVGYFNIGSNIFKQKTEKSIFEVSNAVQLGKHQSDIRLPSNATSLMTNFIGYHLLTYADTEYQQRFMHNLYFAFWRSFIFENGAYPEEEMNKMLDMTVEFCKYMQHGISIVNYFINEYLSCFVDEHSLKLLALMEWSTISLPELQNYVLKHMKLLFYTSTLDIKCKIIRSLRTLLLNLIVINDDSFKDKSFPFLGQSVNSKLSTTAQVIENFTRELIISGINLHSYNAEILSEAASFYEQKNALKIYKTSFVTLPPTALIYGCFTSRSCALLSRVCALLLHCRKYFKEPNNRAYIKMMKLLIVYAEDLMSALWYDNCFSNRLADNRYFLKRLSKEIVESCSSCDIDSLLNIYKHFAVLPYIYTLSKSGLPIRSKSNANSVAAHYYSHVHQFINALLRKDSSG